MPAQDAQQFLRDLDKKLWGAADRLRASLDAAVYKHAVLGLIFLKYVSDSFAVRQKEIEAQLRDPKSDYFLDPKDYKKPAAYKAAIRAVLEERDYYLENNDKTYTQLQLDPANLSSLIDLIATIPFEHADLLAFLKT